ncbi:hypothetical protein XA68_10715 [Ophiocordyceps unilateralis]|uniref:Retrotransposon gag domain-containing protein n=1 Tax=Ophiocordyceps unilateralis TaxID=268505 RepID=A0A2A9PP05_OPHUN|nr:hypothetical protein XA68_10715 [Ophiocordyceps unilateralis]
MEDTRRVTRSKSRQLQAEGPPNPTLPDTSRTTRSQSRPSDSTKSRGKATSTSNTNAPSTRSPSLPTKPTRYRDPATGRFAKPPTTDPPSEETEALEGFRPTRTLRRSPPETQGSTFDDAPLSDSVRNVPRSQLLPEASTSPPPSSPHRTSKPPSIRAINAILDRISLAKAARHPVLASPARRLAASVPPQSLHRRALSTIADNPPIRTSSTTEPHHSRSPVADAITQEPPAQPVVRGATAINVQPIDRQPSLAGSTQYRQEPLIDISPLQEAVDLPPAPSIPAIPPVPSVVADNHTRWTEPPHHTHSSALLPQPNFSPLSTCLLEAAAAPSVQTGPAAIVSESAAADPAHYTLGSCTDQAGTVADPAPHSTKHSGTRHHRQRHRRGRRSSAKGATTVAAPLASQPLSQYIEISSRTTDSSIYDSMARNASTGRGRNGKAVMPPRGQDPGIGPAPRTPPEPRPKPPSLRNYSGSRPPTYHRRHLLKDAAWIQLAQEEFKHDGFHHLREVFSFSAGVKADFILMGAPRDEQRLLQAEVLREMHNNEGPLQNRDDFAMLIDRFESALPMDSPPSRRSDPSPSRRRSDMPDSPPKRARHAGSTLPNGDAPTSQDFKALLCMIQGLAEKIDRQSQQPVHQTTPRDTFQSQDARLDHPPALPANHASMPPWLRHLKPETFVLDTSKIPISAYIQQLDFLGDMYGRDNILCLIVPGLLSKPDTDGARWFGSLDRATQARLASDFELWRTLLSQRFRKDRGATMIEADQLVHRFDNEDELSLQAYIDRKIQLYNEVGNTDDDTVARRVLMGVDPALAKLVSLPSGRVTIEEVKHQLISRQYAAKRDWDDLHQQMSTLRSLVDKTRSTTDRRSPRRQGDIWRDDFRRDDTRRDTRRDDTRRDSRRDDARRAPQPVDASFKPQDDRRPWQRDNRRGDRRDGRRDDQRDDRRGDRQDREPRSDRVDKPQERRPLRPVTLNTDQARKVFGDTLRDGGTGTVKVYVTAWDDDSDGSDDLIDIKEENPDSPADRYSPATDPGSAK